MAGTQTARGSVRDVLAALQNLEHLLRSPRVGPKALSQVIREIRPSCQPIGDVFQQLIDQIATRIAEPDLVQALASFARERAVRLDASLVKAASRDVGARSRLSLEVEVRLLRAELDAVRELVDLLDAAVTFSATELDINALTTHALAVRAPSDVRRADVVRVITHPCGECAAMVSDPRVLMPLIAHGIALCAQKNGVTVVDIKASCEGADTIMTFVPASSFGGDSVLCATPRVIEHTRVLTELAAREAGVSFDAADGGPIRLRVPPGQVSQPALRVPAPFHQAPHS